MTESLLGLLIEFDEMGFAPTTVCADPEGFAVRWKEQLMKEIEALKSENEALRNEADENAALSMQNKMRADRLEKENAALRERLEKAVELKAKVGDTIFLPWIYDDVSGVCELQVCAIHFLYDGSIIYSTDLEKGYGEGFEERRFLMKYHYGEFSQDDFGSMVYTFKEAAEARLAELKGEDHE